MSMPYPQPAAERAWQELRATLDRARANLDRVRAVPTTTPEERRELQRVAASGELGPEMRELARHVQAGRTTWADVFEGTSPYTDLLRPHLDRMVALHGESVRRQIEADPEFDPMAPHDDM